MTDRLVCGDRLARLGLLFTLVGALVAPAAAGPGYRWIDADGNVRWSDQPPPSGAALTPAPSALAAPTYGNGSPFATGGPAIYQVTTDELLTLSGLDRQIPAFASQLAQQLAEAGSGLSPADQRTARRVLQAAIDRDRLRRAIHAEFAQRAAPAHMLAVAAWYRGQVGARVADAAAALGTPEGQKALTSFVAQQQHTPVVPARAAMIEQLEWLGGDVDTAADLMLTATRTLALSLNAALPAEHRQRPGVLGHHFDEARPRLVDSMRGPMLSSLAFIYRDFSDAEVRQTIEFESSPAARWFAAAARQAFTRAARDAADRSARELVRAIPPERWRGAAVPSEVR